MNIYAYVYMCIGKAVVEYISSYLKWILLSSKMEETWVSVFMLYTLYCLIFKTIIMNCFCNFLENYFKILVLKVEQVNTSFKQNKTN